MIKCLVDSLKHDWYSGESQMCEILNKHPVLPVENMEIYRLLVDLTAVRWYIFSKLH